MAQAQDDSELPIALRRAKRRNSAISPMKNDTTRQPTDFSDHTDSEIAATSPSKRQPKKRVRFSDPRSSNTSTTTVPTNTTGLTPSFHRTSLNTPRRRRSTPLLTTTRYTENGNEIEEIQFTPLRQVLDERCKRRIRRNHLSEEVSEWDADWKTARALEKKIEEKDEELNKLKKELEAAHNQQPTTAAASGTAAESFASSQQRADEVETELAALKESFNEFSPLNTNDLADIDWSHVNAHKAGVTPGPRSEGGDTISIWEDDEADPIVPDSMLQPADAQANNAYAADADLLALALDLESAKQVNRQLFQSVRGHLRTGTGTELYFPDTPSSTQQPPNPMSLSRSLPSPPENFHALLSATLKSTTARAEAAETALAALQADVSRLGFAGQDAAAVLTTLVSQFRASRLELERLLPGETSTGLNDLPALLPTLLQKLRFLHDQLKDREAQLTSLHTQQRSLRGNFAHALSAGEVANARVRELEDAVEQGAEEMLSLRVQAQQAEQGVAEKEKSIESLIAALGKYREDVSRLEELVTRLEGETAFRVLEAREEEQAKFEDERGVLDAKVAAEERGRRAAEDSAVTRLAIIARLETQLADAVAEKGDVEQRLVQLQGEKEDTELALQKKLLAHDEQAAHDLGSLNVRIANLRTALAAANAEVTKQAALTSKLEARVVLEAEQAQLAVEAIAREQVKAVLKADEKRKGFLRGMKVRSANWEIAVESEAAVQQAGADPPGPEPLTPASLVRFADVDEEYRYADADADAEEAEEAEEAETDREPEPSASASASVPGGVELRRGKKRWRGAEGVKMHRHRRRYDSAIGMSPASETDGDCDGVVMGGGELSSEADVMVD